MNKLYINLTSGAELIPNLVSPNNDYYICDTLCSSVGFIRIQSTHLEQKQFGKVLEELDYNFLLDLAAGHKIILLDTSSRKKVSRAIFQGIPWITYVLNRLWCGYEMVPMVKNHNVQDYFREQFLKLNNDNLKKILYIGKLGQLISPVKLEGFCLKSNLDGKYLELGKLIFDFKKLES